MTREPLVVDANILFAALLRDSTTRHLILHAGLRLCTPAWLWEEFARNRAFLLDKSRATPASFDLLLSGLQDRICSVPLEVIRPQMEKAHGLVGPEGRLDAPYVATALTVGGAIWTHDRHLDGLGVAIVTTGELVEGLRD